MKAKDVRVGMVFDQYDQSDVRWGRSIIVEIDNYGFKEKMLEINNKDLISYEVGKTYSASLRRLQVWLDNGAMRLNKEYKFKQLIELYEANKSINSDK